MSCTTQDGYQVAIVEVEQDWKPTDWNDAPRRAVVAEVVKTCGTLGEAEGWIFGYNTGALEVGRSWAVIFDIGEPVAPGACCRRKQALFTAEPSPAAPAVCEKFIMPSQLSCHSY
jgi:hypothetical protein